MQPIISVVWAIGGLLLMTAPAYAYLDPGTGSMLLQGLLAAIAAASAAVTVFWHKIKGFFARLRGGKATPPGPASGIGQKK
jgi:hypothetical protein